MDLLLPLLALVVGAVVGWWWRGHSAQAALDDLASRRDAIGKELETLRTRHKALEVQADQARVSALEAAKAHEQALLGMREEAGALQESATEMASARADQNLELVELRRKLVALTRERDEALGASEAVDEDRLRALVQERDDAYLQIARLVTERDRALGALQA